MATPSEWLNEFQVNTGTAATGSQSDPKILGLNNGHFIVAWVEATNGAIAGASPAGTDIIAKIYDAEGNVVRDSYRLNQYANADDERDFELTATHDGFAMTLVDDDISSPNQTSIVYERFDFDGDRQFGTGTGFNIQLENVAADFLRNPQIAANLIASNDDIFVAYDDDVGTNTNINARVIDQAGALGAEFGAAQNSADFDRLGDVTVLSNGNFVTVYEENDSGTTSLEFTIRTASGTVVGVNAFALDNGPASDPRVDALEGGGFVATWVDGSDIYARGFSNTGSQTFATTLVAGGTNSQNEPVVVGLPDGDFIVAWDDDTNQSLRAQRFNANGSTDGGQFVVENVGTTNIDISVTGDGRILFAWTNQSSGEVFASVWDPRPNTIDPDDYDLERAHVLNSSVITTGVSGSTVLSGGLAEAYTVLGQGGNDTIYSSSNGEFFGGGGNDTIHAGGFTGSSDFELLNGGTGIDTLITTSFSGDYTVNLATGATDYFGAPIGGNESFINFENITTGSGDDTITGTAGANIIRTGDGNDTVNASSGSDTIYLGAGDDIATSSGLDTIFGEAGNDTIFAGLGLPETLDGGSGIDTLDTTLFNGNYEIDLASGGTNFAGESFTNFENVVSGNGADELLGTNGANIMNGGGGNDRILGFDGNDTLLGGLGNDVLNGGNGSDNINGGDGDDRLFGRDGNDVMDGGAGADLIVGNIGNDTIDGGLGDDTLRGREGADVVNGGGGNDTIFGADGNDTIRGGDGDDLLNGGAGGDFVDGEGGNDEVVGGADADTLLGGDGADTLRGNGGNDFLNGENDDDLIFGSAGDDTIFGGNGNDTLEGNTQSDDLFGQSGNDILRGGDGFDFLDGGSGDDTLNGGNGSDTLVGGLGVDFLRGGGQNDVFDFNSTSESSFSASDVIQDMEGIGGAGGDLIDLSTIDANTTLGGNQAFTFLGLQTTAVGLSFGAGALWLENAGGQTRVLGNTDADNTIELAINIADGGVFSAADYFAGDFIL